RYEAWLHRLAVRFVAVSDAGLDYSAVAETKLIDRGLPYLRLVMRTRHWRVYAGVNPTPIATGGATLRAIGPNLPTLDAKRGWADLARQFTLFAGAFAFYDLVRGLVGSGSPYRPFSDAMRIIDFERATHIFVEPSINAWAQNKHLVIDATDWIYLNGHFFVTV